MNTTETQTVKTIKTFRTIEGVIEYIKLIKYPKSEEEARKELNKNALIKYGSILILFDPFRLLD